MTIFTFFYVIYSKCFVSDAINHSMAHPKVSRLKNMAFMYFDTFAFLRFNLFVFILRSNAWDWFFNSYTLFLLLFRALAKSKVRYWNQTKHCIDSRRNDGLVKQQVRICKQNLELMGVVAHASRETGHVCQELFKDRRWNCSSVAHAPNFMADLTGGDYTFYLIVLI